MPVASSTPCLVKRPPGPAGAHLSMRSRRWYLRRCLQPALDPKAAGNVEFQAIPSAFPQSARMNLGFAVSRQIPEGSTSNAAAEIGRELNVKDILCVATFASTLLCLVAFVFMLRPHGISPVEATTKPQPCKLASVHPLRMQKSC
ncbi:hypothetical protein [Bradyrhizobium sp. USDA 3364]